VAAATLGLTRSDLRGGPPGGQHMSLRVGLRPGVVPYPGQRAASPVAVASDPAGRPSTAAGAGSGALRRGTLRFLDKALERRYQLQGGAEGLAPFRLTTASGVGVWLLAAIVVPIGMPMTVELAYPVCGVMALINAIALLLSGRAETLDRQHLMIAALTSVNGLVILWFASTAGVLPGYGISALMLLFIYGFVSRTGFVFAAYRSTVIAVGLVVVATGYAGDRAQLLVDVFIFGAAMIGALIALRLLEQSRRRVFYQDIVITRQAGELRLEKQRVDSLLLNILPASISARLIAGERTIADAYPSATILFADIVGFTALAARLSANEVIDLLGRLFERFDELVAARGLEKIKTIGDAYMVAGGLPGPRHGHAALMVDLGLAMIDVAREEGGAVGGLDLRVGVHSGPVIAGVIGHRRFAFDVWGDTVNIASRLESQGVVGRLHVSEAVWHAVEGRFDGEPRGSIDLRGLGPMETWLIGARLDGTGRADRPRPPVAGHAIAGGGDTGRTH
jgi:adenylate cyclase